MQEEKLALPANEELSAQLTNRTSAVNLSGKTVLEPKDHMRSRGAPSPGLADALALSFAGTTTEDWDKVYGVVRCPRCGHGYVDPDRARPCPKCGMAPGTRAP